MGARQPVIGAFERDYTAYDANGNLTAFTDLRTAANDAYGYDPLNRLVTADGTFGSQAFGYDRNANRLSWLDNATTTTYDYAPGSNRLVREGTATVTLDANGNITAQGQRAYTHSPDNRIVSVSESGTLVATYAYNALGQRVAKTVGGATTRFIYGQNGELLAETDATGTVLREYIYLNGTPLAVLDSTGVHYLHTDHLGTPRAATDQTGRLVWTWISDPFGATAANDDPDGDGTTFTLNLRFPGQYFDTETGLHYNYFRYYDPATGRYVTSDPIGLAGGLNTYGYVGGNPVGGMDVFGLKVGYVDPEFQDDIEIIRSTPKGRDLWKKIEDLPYVVNIYASQSHCDNYSQPRKDANGKRYYDIYVYPKSHPHLKFAGYDSEGNRVRYGSPTRALSHELGHPLGVEDTGGNAYSGALDAILMSINDEWAWESNYMMENVNTWENPVMTPIDGFTRTRYMEPRPDGCTCGR